MQRHKSTVISQIWMAYPQNLASPKAEVQTKTNKIERAVDYRLRTRQKFEKVVQAETRKITIFGICP